MYIEFSMDDSDRCNGLGALVKSPEQKNFFLVTKPSDRHITNTCNIDKSSWIVLTPKAVDNFIQ
jgi:hypothetical protein